MAEVSLEPTIRAIEVDRTGLAVLGSLAAAIPGVLIIVLVMILAIVLSGLAGGGFPIAGFGKVIGFGLGVPVAILAGLALLRQRLPRGYTGLLLVLLLAGLGSSLVEPVWLMAIDATSPEAVQIKQRLLGTAAWTVPSFDVLRVEPPSTGNVLLAPQLLALPNFLLTPHVAWASRPAMQALADQLTANLEAFNRGEPQNQVV